MRSMGLGKSNKTLGPTVISLKRRLRRH